jgi:predicted metal-dependent hydrolase
LDSLEITYKWSPRRRTIGLTVTAEGRLVVAAPRGASKAQISRALKRHRAWIERKIAQRRAAWEPLKEGLAFYRGRPYRLTVTLGPPATVALGAEDLLVRLPGDGADLWPLLNAWYIQEAERIIWERVRHFGVEMGLAVGGVQMRHWKRRWGECRPQGSFLRFNWRLILVPPEILDYVVVHELAHLKEPGHTARFWQEVAQLVPDYAHRRGWLNTSGTPFLTWKV